MLCRDPTLQHTKRKESRHNRIPHKSCQAACMCLTVKDQAHLGFFREPMNSLSSL